MDVVQWCLLGTCTEFLILCSFTFSFDTPLTCRWRAFNPRKKLKQQKKAAAMVQKSFKKRLDRKHFGIAFAECVDAARKQKQMKSLLHALSSDRNQDKDKLLDDCQM
eukprot:530838-Ditylum_brightwellii.AAC.1